MAVSTQINIEIDKLTRSLENAVSGDSFKTDILPLFTTVLIIVFNQYRVASWTFSLG
jgi:hypothetical protein